MPADTGAVFQVQTSVSAHMSPCSRVEKRISCVIRHKQRKTGSFRALERIGRHGSGYAKRWVERYQEDLSLQKSVQDRAREGRPPKISDEHISYIKGLVETNEKVGSAEVARKLATQFGLRVSAVTVRKALNKNGFQYSTPKRVLAHNPVQRVKRRNFSVKYKKTEKTGRQQGDVHGQQVIQPEPISSNMFSTTVACHWQTSYCLSIQAVKGGACVHGSHCVWRD
jgi:transposase